VQKGGFYVAKTPFLFSEYVTATELTSYTQFSMTHCIFTKWVANRWRWRCEWFFISHYTYYNNVSHELQ